MRTLSLSYRRLIHTFFQCRTVNSKASNVQAVLARPDPRHYHTHNTTDDLKTETENSEVLRTGEQRRKRRITDEEVERLPGSEKLDARWVMPNTEEPGRLDRFIKRHAPGVPPGLVQRIIRKRLVRVNGEKAIHNAHTVYPGDEVIFPGWVKLGLTRGKRAPPADDPTLAEAEMARSWIIHRDARSAVINKPPGVPVTPVQHDPSQTGSGEKGRKFRDSRRKTTLNKASLHKDEDSNGGAHSESSERADTGPRSVHSLLTAFGAGRYWLVHRLDAAASGALLLVRDVGAAGILSEAFRSRKVQRTYWALVHGRPRDKSGTVEMDIDGKRARTKYETIRDISGQFSWLLLSPTTGRKHQLRVHCALALGCPIVGDEKYGPGGPGSVGRTGESRGATFGSGSRFPKRRVIRSDDDGDGDGFGSDAQALLLNDGGVGLHLLARSVTYPVLTQIPAEATRHGPRRNSKKEPRYITVTAPLPAHMAASWRRFGLREDMADGGRGH